MNFLSSGELNIPSYVDASKCCIIPFSFIECKVYKTLNERDRSQSYLYKSDQGARPTCDRWLTRDWYRFTGLAGNRMPDKCVPVERCGTLAPGWLQGGHPNVHAGVVSRMVCFSWGRDCCTWRSRILVRNCGDFYVYKLQNAPVCKLRYCGVGNSEGKIWCSTPSCHGEGKKGRFSQCYATRLDNSQSDAECIQSNICTKILPFTLSPATLSITRFPSEPVPDSVSVSVNIEFCIKISQSYTLLAVSKSQLRRAGLQIYPR